jgi:hypothetical protein
MRCCRLVLVSFSITLALAACGPNGSSDDTGDDGPDGGPVCVDGTTQCTGNTFESCEGGQWQTENQCSALCDDELGCVVCFPGGEYCDGDNVMACNDTGSGGTLVETCSGGAHCLGGDCVDLCAEAAESKSYIGCEYYAVDLDNAIEILDNPFAGLFPCSFSYPGSQDRSDIQVCWNASGDSAGLCDPGNTCPASYTCQLPTDPVCVLDAAHSPFAVVVSNPQSFTVNVTMTQATGTPQTVAVNAGQVTTLFPQMMSFPDSSLDRSMQGKNAYKIVADGPVVAYQFNPLNNVDVFSNDASLLIPTTTWDDEYYVMSWPTLTRRTAPESTNDYNGYLAVIASADDTVVEVTPSAGTRANGAIAAITAGTPTQFTLDAYEVLNLEAIADGDLTGSFVRSMDPAKPIGVFGGHEAVVVAQNPAPNPSLPNGPCCADHVEDMMFPASTWGKAFAIARSKVRNADADHLRIMAQKPGTTVTFTPAPLSGTCGTLDAGDFCEVKINADTKVDATEPVLIGHFLESVIWNDGLATSMGNGDPSMSIAVPTEQFRTSYTILVPSQYMENYVAISTPTTGSVTVDGADVSSMLTAFGGTHRAGRITVAAGQHTIQCSAGCGIEVMGYSDAVSYLFAGGLDLRIIVVD